MATRLRRIHRVLPLFHAFRLLKLNFSHLHFVDPRWCAKFDFLCTSMKFIQIMLPKTYLSANHARRLGLEALSASVLGGVTIQPSSSVFSSSFSYSSSSFSSPPSSSSSTPYWRRDSRRGHFVVKRRWWLPHIPDLDDVKNYPYNEHERGD